MGFGQVIHRGLRARTKFAVACFVRDRELQVYFESKGEKKRRTILCWTSSMAMCLAVVRLYACGSVGTTCASTDTDTQEANNSPTKGLQGGFVIPFSLVYTAIAPLSGVAVSPAGTLQHSRAPIRCQILGCFQATYIRPRGKRASNALKDVLSLFEGERSSVCFLCPCE